MIDHSHVDLSKSSLESLDLIFSNTKFLSSDSESLELNFISYDKVDYNYDINNSKNKLELSDSNDKSPPLTSTPLRRSFSTKGLAKLERKISPILRKDISSFKFNKNKTCKCFCRCYRSVENVRHKIKKQKALYNCYKLKSKHYKECIKYSRLISTSSSDDDTSSNSSAKFIHKLFTSCLNFCKIIKKSKYSRLNKYTTF